MSFNAVKRVPYTSSTTGYVRDTFRGRTAAFVTVVNLTRSKTLTLIYDHTEKYSTFRQNGENQAHRINKFRKSTEIGMVQQFGACFPFGRNFKQ